MTNPNVLDEATKTKIVVLYRDHNVAIRVGRGDD